jgi:hypothetical protein
MPHTKEELAAIRNPKASAEEMDAILDSMDEMKEPETETKPAPTRRGKRSN